jgi:hypothetical protein
MSLAAILLIIAQGISSQPVQSEASNLSKGGDNHFILNEPKQSAPDSLVKNSNENAQHQDTVQNEIETTFSGSTVMFIAIVVVVGLVFAISYHRRMKGSRKKPSSKPYRAPAEETVTLTGHPQHIPRRTPSKGALPRLLSKDSDMEDEELLSMIEKETKMEKLDLWSNLNGNLTDQNTPTPTNVKEHPVYSLY